MDAGSSPQFDTAHFPGQDSEPCSLCGQPVGKSYYRIDGLMACANCAFAKMNATEAQPQGSFGRGLLFGLGGALAGLALYSTVGIVTGYEIGFVSLAVGFLVGKSILKGSGGVGGRSYQIAAVLLTYFAVSVSAVPIGIAYMIKQGSAAGQVVVEQGAEESSTQAAAADESVVDDEVAAEAAAEDAAEDALAAESAAEDSVAEDSTAAVSGEDSEPMSWSYAIVVLLGVGLASPFLGLADMPSGAIGMIILLVGLHIAWQQTAAGPSGEVDGPFENSPAPPSEG